MAAYLVGLRGTLRQAAIIGATVTITHTAGVLLLGLVLTTSRAVAPERLYPWLGLASGLLLAGVGVGLLVRARTGHHPARPRTIAHPHDHHHDHGPAAARCGRRGLVALGLAGGLVPSPSAVVVLLGRDRARAGLVRGGPGAGLRAGDGGDPHRGRCCWPSCGTGWTGASTCRPGRCRPGPGRLLPAAVSGSVIVLVGVAVAIRGAAGI